MGTTKLKSSGVSDEVEVEGIDLAGGLRLRWRPKA
jgi:hypothetical protein